MDSKKLVITHDKCVDGWASEAILRDFIGDEAIYMPMSHGDYDLDTTLGKENWSIVSQIKNSHVYMADICLPKPWLDLIINNGNQLTVIDHHISAIKDVEYLKSLSNPDITIVFDYNNKKSGAKLTWEHITKKPSPAIIELISDADTWGGQFPESVFLSRFIYKKGLTEDTKDWLGNMVNKSDSMLSELELCLSKGREIDREFMEKVYSIVKNANPIRFFNHDAYIVEAGSEFTSQVGHELSKASNNGIGLVYQVDSDNNIVKVGMRSIGDLDVSKIASQLGGGGHKNASAFRVKNIQELNDLLVAQGNHQYADSTQEKKKKLKP